jgi:hypothetical protein
VVSLARLPVVLHYACSENGDKRSQGAAVVTKWKLQRAAGHNCHGPLLCAEGVFGNGVKRNRQREECGSDPSHLGVVPGAWWGSGFKVGTRGRSLLFAVNFTSCPCNASTTTTPDRVRRS